MRSSLKCDPTASFTARAEAKLLPIGFSTTTRALPPASPAWSSRSQIGPNSSGAVAR
jgi:hypothetical protein